MKPLKDFGPISIAADKNMKTMVRSVKPYTATEFTKDAHEEIEEIHSCTINPARYLVRSSATRRCLRQPINSLESSQDLPQKYSEYLFKQRISFGTKKAVKNNRSSSITPMRILFLLFAAGIASNFNRAIFFNLRYYEQVFAKERQRTKGSPLIMSRIVNFYYLTSCHELTHNLYTAHDVSFIINHMQEVAVKFMRDKDLYLETVLMGYERDHN
jgi:hypothetical protein